MERHLDFTIDFETCSLQADAAPMQVAVVPWLRDSDTEPFCNENELKPLVLSVDLRTCVVDGFDFDPETIRWWSSRSDAAKAAVTSGTPVPAGYMAESIHHYIRSAAETYDLQSVCLWSQGPDVDIAILRSLCKRYGLDLEGIVPHTQFRDCRTLVLEAALREARRSLDGKGTRSNGIVLPNQVVSGSYDAYKMFEPMPERYAGEAHDALYDARLESWNTWQALKWINS